MAERILTREEALQMRPQLDEIIKRMAKLQKEIERRQKEYEELKKQAFPIVEAFGDKYTVDRITAEIIRGQTWKVDPLKLLKKFKEKVYPLLIVSSAKFRQAYESGLLGPSEKLEGIAKLVDMTPKFRILSK